MARFDIGTYKDRKVKWEDLLRKKPLILEDAIQDSLGTYPDQYVQIGPDHRHKDTGALMEDDVAKLESTNPHWFANFVAEADEHTLTTELVEAACLRPTVDSVSKVFKLLGETRARTVFAQRGVDIIKMKAAGTAEKKDGASGGTPPHRNPWHPTAWHGTEQQRHDEIERLFRTMGTKRCEGIAFEAGYSVTGTKLR
jgi:hypothetical protein